MDVKKKIKGKKPKGLYRKNSNRFYDDCSPASGCGPNFEIVLNIKQRKEAQEENKVE